MSPEEHRWIAQQQKLELEADYTRRSDDLERRESRGDGVDCEPNSLPSFGQDMNSVAYQPVRSSEEQLTQENHHQERDSVVASHHSLASAIATKPPTPWKALMRRREVWAIIISQFCNSLGFFVMQSWLPTFYLDYYGVDVGRIGYYAVVPSVTQGTVGLISGYLGDKAVQDWHWTTLTVRRVGQCLGSVGLATFLILAVRLAKDATTAMILISIGMALNGFTMIGASAYQHDFCPQHAGFIFSLGNTAGTIPGLIGVFLVGFLLDKDKNTSSIGDTDDKAKWNLIWTFVCFFYLLGSTVFVLLSTNKRFPRTT
ncbi:hypothetical protein BGZ83_003886 [Gryganskiella cystojenkinii]|nr:hypothetical protein BGZ83_003886 [Gryganskiella cystojenkinii]